MRGGAQQLLWLTRVSRVDFLGPDSRICFLQQAIFLLLLFIVEFDYVHRCQHE